MLRVDVLFHLILRRNAHTVFCNGFADSAGVCEFSLGSFAGILGFAFFDGYHSYWGDAISHHGFACFSRMVSDAQRFSSTCGPSVCFLLMMPIQVICPLFNWIVCFLMLRCLTCLYSLDINPLLDE